MPAGDDPKPSAAEQGNGDETEGPEVLPPALAKQIPPKVREQVSALFMSTRAWSDPLAAKIKSEHITRAMDLAQDNANKNFDFARGTRWFQFSIFIISIAVAIFLIVYLIQKEKTDILAPLLAALLGFASGFGIGKANR